MQSEIANKLDEWFSAGLADWDISRDEPYFGFPIPGAPGKYFYVWLDAPIGYMAATAAWCARTGSHFGDWWGPDAKTELYHFIGKDIAYFHTLFWPAMLMGAKHRLPDAVYCHGFLTVNGAKMSKSRGTFLRARDFADRLDAELLRYYFAARLGPGVDDIDLDLADFAQRINADLVGKLVNLASRCAGFIEKLFAGRLDAALPDPALYDRFRGAAQRIATHYEQREYAQAMREIMALADEANRYIDAHKPWVLAKDPLRHAEVHAICTQGINLYRTLIGYLKPVLPALAERSERYLAAGPLDWRNLGTPLLDHRLAVWEPLLTRVDPAIASSLITPLEVTNVSAPPTTATETASATIAIDDLAKIDLRVARIVKAETVEGADRLLHLTVDDGNGERNVFAGIRDGYAPESLTGRLVVLVANLAPRKMRFGVSEGMLLAAGDGNGVFLLAPDQGAQPGMKIK